MKKLSITVCMVVGLFISVIGINNLKESLPSHLNVVVNESKEFDFNLPLEGIISIKPVAEIEKSNIPEGAVKINLNKPFQLEYEATGSYNMECKLFGIFSIKDIDIDVIEKQYVIPCGNSIGIYIKTDGIMVIGTGAITGMDGINYEPALNKIDSGDYIMAINNEPLANKTELIEKINEYGNEDIVLTVCRNDELVDIKLNAVECALNDYKLGIWVRDNTQGIGTLTYIDKEGHFGALGHGINDVDTSLLMKVSGGNLYNTKIVSIVKGEKGVPGELTGSINYNKDNIIGDINYNTSHGIFGMSNVLLKKIGQNPLYEVCLKQDIEEGRAYIRSDLTGTMKEYEIEIEKVNINENSINKGMVIKIVDEELLELTGGIVQGLSGAPIIQNGKICGAVTHVFVQDPTKGYGIFIEDMLEH